MSEAIILCEGYYDRDFWAGWLERLGCPPPPTDRKVVDDRGLLVERGHFGYRSPGGRFIRIAPCRGYDKVLPAALTHIGDRAVEQLSHIVPCIDPDIPADGTSTATGLRLEDLLRKVRESGLPADLNADGDIDLDNGATKVSLVRWEVPGDDAPGVPRQQTLERLACSALIAAYPARGDAIVAWLENRPDAPAAGPKEHAWSHMAGWYAGFGCAAFYKNLWTIPQVASELETRLKACGAWRVAERLVS